MKNYNNYDRTMLDSSNEKNNKSSLSSPPSKKRRSPAILVIIALVAVAVITIAVALSRGWKLDVSVSKDEPSSEQQAQNNSNQVASESKPDSENEILPIRISSTVYTTEYGTKYHLEDCEYLTNSTLTDITLERAVQRGYEPCGACHPPQPEEMTVYTTAKGTKFHTADCEWLTVSAQKTTLGEAEAQGYVACGACDPLGSAQ